MLRDATCSLLHTSLVVLMCFAVPWCTGKCIPDCCALSLCVGMSASWSDLTSSACISMAQHRHYAPVYKHMQLSCPMVHLPILQPFCLTFLASPFLPHLPGMAADTVCHTAGFRTEQRAAARKEGSKRSSSPFTATASRYMNPRASLKPEAEPDRLFRARSVPRGMSPQRSRVANYIKSGSPIHRGSSTQVSPPLPCHPCLS